MKAVKGSAKSMAWPVTAVAVCAGIAIAMIQNKTLPCVTVLQQTFGLSKAGVGWLSSAFCVTGIISAFPGAMIVDRAGVKRAGVLALAFAVVGSVLGAFSKSASMLLISRIIEGMGAGVVSIAVPTAITMWFPAGKRGLPMGLWAAWQVLAMALVFFFGTGLLAAVGWRGIWWLCTAIAAALLIAYALVVDEPPAEQAQCAPEESGKGASAGSLKNKNVWLIALSMLFYSVTSFAFATWAAPCWAETFGLGAERANLALSILFLVELPTVILAGWGLRLVGIKRFLLIAFAGMALSAFAAFTFAFPALLTVLTVAYPVFEGSVITALWSSVPLTVKRGENTASAFALFTLMGNVGMFAGPPIAGALMDAAGWAAGGKALLAVTAAGAALAVFARLSDN